MNRFSLQAAIIEREAMRYTPAGIPIVNATLFHSGAQIEAGIERRVEIEVTCQAVGALAQRLADLSMERSYLFHGFMAKKHRQGKSLVMHIMDIA
ncbi:primosomal replication protein N [Massilia sp. W12]|uniref:primosomal replication protein N n=1 Tax=Massilia sp. W12 TaxID=3126507 RepID=UPI0030CF044E